MLIARLLACAALTLASCGVADAATPFGQITRFPVGPAGQVDPAALTSGPDGNLWFTDADTDEIGRMTVSGGVAEFGVGLRPDHESEPTAITAGPDGNVWFIDSGAKVGDVPEIGRVTPTGQITEFRASLGDTTGTTSYPESIAAGPDGNVWLTAASTELVPSTIDRVAPDGTITRFTAGPAVDGDGPNAIAEGPDGNLWFTALEPASPGSGVSVPEIGRITVDGQISTFRAGLQPHASPDGIVAGRDGNLWFADDGGHPAIGRVTPSGQITEYSAGLQPAETSELFDLVAGPDGNVWFTDKGLFDDTLGRVTPSGAITEFSVATRRHTLDLTGAITAGPDGDIWFTASGRVDRFGLAGAPRASEVAPTGVRLGCVLQASHQLNAVCVSRLATPVRGGHTANRATLVSNGAVCATGTWQQRRAKLVVALGTPRCRAIGSVDVKLVLTHGSTHRELSAGLFGPDTDDLHIHAPFPAI